MTIRPKPGAAEINYVFNKNMTFIMTNQDSKNKSKGTWTYDSKKRLIRLTSGTGPKINIVSLKEGELVMLMDADKAVPDDLKAMQMVYKPKAK